MIELIFPLPCSVNELYVYSRTGKKILTKKGREWKKTAYYLIMQYKLKNVIFSLENCTYSIFYHFYFPDHKKRDAANYLKQIDDALVTAGIIRDDSLIYQGSYKKQIVKGKREVKVLIEGIKNEKDC